MRPEPQQKIDEKALSVWKISGGITSLFFWVIPIGYAWLDHHFVLLSWITWLLTGIVLGMTILTTFAIPVLRWRRWRYEINEHELDLKYGVFIVKRTLIPMVRIQHVDTKQGPLLRHYQLATVTISTAGAQHEIPALSEEVADAVRDRISQLAQVADDDV